MTAGRSLAQRVLDGDPRAVARAMSLIEDDAPGAAAIVRDLFPHAGRAYVVGVTGPPGAGKSTLVDRLITAARADGETVGVIAVDPTSPFTGGSILGDRLRMQAHAGDAGVFIRSMATRGSLGGLARATRDAARVLDAGGFDIILIETVGSGQSEVDIALTAETTLVVETPGMGDDIQAIKAGILEIADILVVNKADRPGTINTVKSLKLMLELGHPASRSQIAAHHGQLLAAETPSGEADENLWIPPIIETVASEAKGTEELVEAVAAHRQFLSQRGVQGQIERQHIEIELYQRLRDALMAHLLQNVPSEVFAATIGRIQAREIDPQRAVQDLLARIPDR